MKFAKQVIIDLLCEEYDENVFEIVEDGDWRDANKYQFRSCIFKFEGKLYKAEDSRSGSPFTDWHYGHEDWNSDVECPEVEAVPVTTIKYKVKKA